MYTSQNEITLFFKKSIGTIIGYNFISIAMKNENKNKFVNDYIDHMGKKW